MDAWIDPNTGAYVAGAGALRGTLLRDPADGLANAVYLRLMTPLGSWFGDASLGSRLHELVREKDLARVEQLARQYAELALQPVVADGRALSVKVLTLRRKDDSRGGRMLLAIQVIDATGTPRTFDVPISVT